MKAKCLVLSICYFLVISQISYSQDYHKIDSLIKIFHSYPSLSGTENDSLRMKVCLDIGDLYENNKPDQAIYWYTSIIDTNFTNADIKQFPTKAYYNAMAMLYTAVVYSNMKKHADACK